MQSALRDRVGRPFGQAKADVAPDAALQQHGHRSLLKAWRAGADALKAQQEAGRAKEAKDTGDRLEALALFRADMATFLRAYSFLSQIFDYGNTAIEARAIVYRRLLPLLGFGRERAEVDTSKIVRPITG